MLAINIEIWLSSWCVSRCQNIEGSKWEFGICMALKQRAIFSHLYVWKADTVQFVLKSFRFPRCDAVS